MRYFPILLAFLVIALFAGCSGKTTVHEEMINKSPDETQNDGQQISDEIRKAADEEKKVQEEEANAGEEEEKPERRPAPGQDNSKYVPPVNEGGGSGKLEPDSKVSRENYLNNTLTYPGSERNDTIKIPSTVGHTGGTFLTDDNPDKVATWYKTKLGDKASVNQTGTGMSGDYHISVDDNENGFKSNIIISRTGDQGKTRIIISVTEK
ncbi:hypothetical protein KKB99_02195 [bacterium]|nr:hypothetical protein [bacterium]MBU1024798.1 hypothetical protein [bacterium]